MGTLLASQVPIPVNYAGFLRIVDGESSLATNAPNAKGIAAGESSTVPAKWNGNMTRIDLAERYGGGIYAVAYGLALSIGTGLNVNVAAGHAVIDGLVEVPAGTSVAVPASSPRVHIWLRRDGVLEVKNNVLTPPATPAVYIGSCVTGASSVTSVDDSGIMKLVSGQPIRQTANVFWPDDTPSSSMSFFTRTLGGLVYWDGARYSAVCGQGRLSKSVAGSSNVTLSNDEAMHTVIELTGALTGNINLIVPHRDGVPTIYRNKTTGAFTLTVIGPSGTGVAVTQGKAVSLYSDGTNIMRAGAESAS